METMCIEVIEYHSEKRWHAMGWDDTERPRKRDGMDVYTFRGKTALVHVFSVDWPMSRAEALVVASAVVAGKCKVEWVDLRR